MKSSRNRCLPWLVRGYFILRLCFFCHVTSLLCHFFCYVHSLLLRLFRSLLFNHLFQVIVLSIHLLFPRPPTLLVLLLPLSSSANPLVGIMKPRMMNTFAKLVLLKVAQAQSLFEKLLPMALLECIHKRLTGVESDPIELGVHGDAASSGSNAH